MSFRRQLRRQEWPPKTRPVIGCATGVCSVWRTTRIGSPMTAETNSFSGTPNECSLRSSPLRAHRAAETRASPRWSTLGFRDTPGATACAANVASTWAGPTRGQMTLPVLSRPGWSEPFKSGIDPYEHTPGSHESNSTRHAARGHPASRWNGWPGGGPKIAGATGSASRVFALL